jgi:outer membrane protein
MRGYYDVVQQQATLAALRNALQTSRERLSVANSKEGIGTSSRLEVMRAQVDLNADSAAVLRQAVIVRNTKATLQMILAKQADDNAVERMNVRDSIVISTKTMKATYNELLAMLKAQNLDLQEARSAQTVAEASVREASAIYYPSVNVTANYNFSNTIDATGVFAQNQLNGWSYGIAGQWTLFNGLNNFRQVQNANIDVLNAQAQYSDAAMRLENSLAQVYRSFQNSMELLKLEQANFAIADETERIGLERFKLGALTSLELREIQQNALRAETRLVTVKFEAKAAEIELMRLSGQLVNAVP